MINLNNTYSNNVSSFYKIANLCIEIIVEGKDVDFSLLFPSFTDFRIEEPEGNFIARVKVMYDHVSFDQDVASLLSDVSGVWGDRFKFFENEAHYTTVIEDHEGHISCCMQSSKDFETSNIYVMNQNQEEKEVLVWLIMVTFAQRCVFFNTTLIHSSVVERGGVGYAFLGKSGTGKSTHSKLWTQYIEGTRLLNDDNPAVQVDDSGKVTIYGTPWSGKTACYRNYGVELCAVVRLEQASINKLQWFSGLYAFNALLPSCSAIRWNHRIFDTMTGVLQRIASIVPIGLLQCLPDRTAAELCFNEIENKLVNKI